MRIAVRDGLRPGFQLVLITALLSTRASTEEIQPISVTFNQDFLGYDGQWSAAQIRVGNPEQWLSLLPSTTESEAWVVGPAGCDSTSTCSSLRGGLFSEDQSKSWQELGLYELGYSALSQNTDNGNYGLDTLSLSDSISVPNQIIAVVNDTQHWLGQLGLNVQDTRFLNTTNFLPFISSLVQNKSLVPSHSYGYTAGASYKGQGVLGSLTIGGVDTTRFVPNDFWFPLAPGYTPSIAVTSVRVAASDHPRGWTANPLTLLSSEQAAVFTIDSNTPFLWFPESVCEIIANALNLTWNENVQLYTFANTSSPQALLDQNLQFTFGLANSTSSDQVLSLNISYNAFNLQLSYPFPGLFESYSDAKISYFPLRRANSTNQYTIGRSFLQETYLTVDYERNVFALSQALFPSSSQQAVLSAITRPKDSTWPGPQHAASASTLSTGVIAGLAIGAVIVLVAAGGMVWWFCVRRRKTVERLEDGPHQLPSGFFSIFSRFSTRKSPGQDMPVELLGDKRHPTEMVSDASNSRYELSSVAPVEMAAAEVPHAFFQPRVNAHITQRNDPRTPVELANPRRHLSTEKNDLDDVVEPPGSPAPAYSPIDGSDSISPYTPIAPRAFGYGSDQTVSSVKSARNSHDGFDRRHNP